MEEGKIESGRDIMDKENVINLDAPEYKPGYKKGRYSICAEDQLTDGSHGEFKWDPDEIEMALTDIDEHNTETFLRETNGKPFLNAAVLDFLLAHPEKIPESWKKFKVINFPGTVYRVDDNSKELWVRHLYYMGDRIDTLTHEVVQKAGWFADLQPISYGQYFSLLGAVALKKQK